MKKPFAVLFCLTALLFAAGCGSNNPTAVTKQFIDAMKKGDVEAAAKCATPETMAAVAMFGEKLKGVMIAYGDIESVKEEVNGDAATVKVKFKNEAEVQDFTVKKVDGKWKIHMESNSGK